jgi:hypothetical protein
MKVTEKVEVDAVTDVRCDVCLSSTQSSRKGSRLPCPLTPPGIRFRTTAVHEQRLSHLTVSSIDIRP